MITGATPYTRNSTIRNDLQIQDLGHHITDLIANHYNNLKSKDHFNPNIRETHQGINKQHKYPLPSEAIFSFDLRRRS